MLELHEFKLARDEVQSGDIRSTYDLGHVPAIDPIAYGAIERFTLANIKFGLMSKEG